MLLLIELILFNNLFFCFHKEKTVNKEIVTTNNAVKEATIIEFNSESIILEENKFVLKDIEGNVIQEYKL